MRLQVAAGDEGAASVAGEPSRWPVIGLLDTRLSGVLFGGGLLALWEASARLGWIVSDNWPAFTQVLVALVRSLWDGELTQALGATLSLMFAGYGIGCVAAIGLGLWLGRSRAVDALLRPPLEVLRTLPGPAILPPLILLLGVDGALKITVIAVGSFFPVFVNTHSGVQGIDQALLGTARTLQLRRLLVLRRIVLPAVAPSIAAGMRISISLALVTAVVAEMISGASGVGYYLMSMQYAMRADTMYAAVLCLAAVGYALNRAHVVIEHRLIFWR